MLAAARTHVIEPIGGRGLREISRETEVVVIGAGSAGAMTAYFLAKRGVPVVVCEKGRVAGE